MSEPTGAAKANLLGAVLWVAFFGFVAGVFGVAALMLAGRLS